MTKWLSYRRMKILLNTHATVSYTHLNLVVVQHQFFESRVLCHVDFRKRQDVYKRQTEKCTVTAPEGYSVRKNVYAGLGGQKDTPYIKVSIHVVRD